jgi:predicted porin
MKMKHIAAASLLACAGTAWAQSSVTLYGVLDTNIEYVNKMSPTAPGTPGFPGAAASKIDMNTGGLSGSRWGLRGDEDLGGGNKALFVLESGFGVNDGRLQQGGRLFGRQAFVGLDTRFGKFTFGRQYTSLFEALANFSPTAYSTQYEPIIFMTGLNFRSDNTAKYTGTFGPVTALAHWSFGNGVFGAGQVPGQFKRDSGYGAAVAYAGGPFGATIAYDQANPSMTPFGDTGYGSAKKLAVAASYTVGPAKLIGGYRWEKATYSNDATFIRDDMWWAGVNYQATQALGLTLAYYYDKLKTLQLSKAGAPSSPANPWQVSFIADYNFSKRTDVYLTTAYARTAGLNFDTSAIGFANGYFPGAGQTSMVGAAVGIRHKF